MNGQRAFCLIVCCHSCSNLTKKVLKKAFKCVSLFCKVKATKGRLFTWKIGGLHFSKLDKPFCAYFLGDYRVFCLWGSRFLSIFESLFTFFSCLFTIFQINYSLYQRRVDKYAPSEQQPFCICNFSMEHPVHVQIGCKWEMGCC